MIKNKLSITPGVAITYYSDFKFHSFPGLDIGYEINKAIKVYGNIGYTYRIPTYTDLYYSSPSTLGNISLSPETALAEEIGFKFSKNNFEINIASFNRNAKNLIDYTKENETDKFQANNIREVATSGIETNLVYNFKAFKQKQKIKFGYNYLQDDIKGLEIPFSRYVLNSTKNHFIANADFSLMKDIRHFVSYKYVERTDGTSYQVLDAKISFKIKQVVVSGVLNNLLDAEYTETNLVPMPERNLMLSLKYNLK